MSDLMKDTMRCIATYRDHDDPWAQRLGNMAYGALLSEAQLEKTNTAPECPRGCRSWVACDEPDDGSARNPLGERHGAGVCMTGCCVEPCGPNGGCTR